jgi:hypothetical protein
MMMSRTYDQDRLQSSFGYRTGYYGRLAMKTKTLPPSLTVYTHTLVALANGSYVPVHMVHAIGLALDNNKQPDMTLLTANKIDCVAFYRLLFRLIFACADDKLGPDSTVVLSLVGGNNFARLYPGGPTNFWRQVWIPALMSHLRTYKGHQKRIQGMGFPLEFQELLKDKDLRKRLEGQGRFPAIVDEYDQTKTLFVNAWDPWSIVGNGNASDNSLDGWVGRSSNVGVLSSSLTNPFLLEKKAYHLVD